ncbi:uncharacterized protein A1O9_03624 [Exophiala aquamarina CBS 119918]|uniref:SET domain-containing protein n=1 Tax=Exophiala aquamarina CBS 119918 TaxID=1182545 RepID=A0A072PG37_9EURO|nr:uncharacterized protein A1O9_03624 [Exophiala aquamarina CBS 119918]KEF58781.1 hypothetical protein A1O9_03624 [Exophiala aquamarina CBS 119918]
MPASSPAVPKNWPRDVVFLRKFHIPPPLSASALQVQIHEAGAYPVITPAPAIPSPLVRITPITLPSHPACGQSGLFAAKALPPDSFVLFYLGHVHDSFTTDTTSNYDLNLDRQLDLSVDATQFGNEARFINDYRGVRGEGPNAEFRDCVAPIGLGLGERRIGVFVLSAGRARKNDKGTTRARGIKKGDEIVVSYGKGFWDARKGRT